jgi:hypothetical protein
LSPLIKSTHDCRITIKTPGKVPHYLSHFVITQMYTDSVEINNLELLLRCMCGSNTVRSTNEPVNSRYGPSFLRRTATTRE